MSVKEQQVVESSNNKLLLNYKVFITSKDKNIFTHTSPIYFCGGKGFQVKMDVAWYSYIDSKRVGIQIIINVRFINILIHDDLLYICKVSSAKTNITDFSFTDTEKWHQFHYYTVEAYLNCGFDFDLSVNIDTAPTVNQFANLYEDKEGTDFKLHCEKGTVNVHKAVLASTSPVFHTMLNGQWKETNEGHVKIPVASIEVLENLKKYIYLKNLPDENLESLIELGSYYAMPELLQRCAVKLVNNLSDNNIVEMLATAIKFRVTNLLEYILKYVEKGLIDFDKIPELVSWYEDLKITAKHGHT